MEWVSRPVEIRVDGPGAPVRSYAQQRHSRRARTLEIGMIGGRQ